MGAPCAPEPPREAFDAAANRWMSVIAHGKAFSLPRKLS